MKNRTKKLKNLYLYQFRIKEILHEIHEKENHDDREIRANEQADSVQQEIDALLKQLGTDGVSEIRLDEVYKIAQAEYATKVSRRLSVRFNEAQLRLYIFYVVITALTLIAAFFAVSDYVYEIRKKLIDGFKV